MTWHGTLPNPEATHALGRRLGEAAEAGWVVSLGGPLGSGKTTLAQGIADGLGVAERLTSPTFVLESRYQGRLLLHHFDLYRFGQAPAEEELIEIGLMEAVCGDGLCVIEWAERLAAGVLADCLRVAFAHAPTGRVVAVRSEGPQYQRIVEELHLEHSRD
jgi:tRNA threonylcarbamoyladenosine biosynthesis protein TsaE